MAKRQSPGDGNEHKRRVEKFVSRCVQIDRVTWRVPPQTVPARYFDVYNWLFRFENKLRMFVYAALRAQYGKDWLHRPIGSARAGGVKGTIDTVTKKRIGSLKSYSYVGEMTEIPMLYLDFDELVGLIQDDRKLFQPLMGGAVQALGSKMDEVRVIRNNMAHFRVVTEEDYLRLERSLRDISPLIEKYIEEITMDEEEYYREDAPELRGLQAHARQLLDGVEHFDISIERSRDWVSVRLVQSLSQTIHKPRHGPQGVWVLDPGFLMVALTKAEVYGSVVCYMSNGLYRESDRTGALSGDLWVRYVLPWKLGEFASPPEIVRFVEVLARLARGLDEEYRHAEVDTPRRLQRVDTPVRKSTAPGHPFLCPLIPRIPCIIEDWTGTWGIMLPWIGQETDRSIWVLR